MCQTSCPSRTPLYWIVRTRDQVFSLTVDQSVQLLPLSVKVTPESAFLNDRLRDSLGAFMEISKIGSFLIIILVP